MALVCHLIVIVMVLLCPPPLLQLVDTTVEISNKVGAAEIASRIVDDLKDENEQYRKMVMDCIEKVGVVSGCGLLLYIRVMTWYMYIHVGHSGIKRVLGLKRIQAQP